MKTKSLLKIFFLISLFYFFVAHAQAEVINSFDSNISVLPDASIVVSEKINYDFEGEFRHGIYRTIPLLNSKNEIIQIDNISVSDRNDKAYPFTTSVFNRVLTIKIGDPDQTISGIMEYKINYRVLGAIGYFKDYDEIYWNITGNDWPVVIKSATAKVSLPDNVYPIQQACYYGKKGSNLNCYISKTNIFTAPGELSVGSGLTVAVGFPKGLVQIYTPKVEPKLIIFLKTFWPISLPVILFIVMFYRWRKYGKDPKGKGVIVPQYDVIDNLTPFEVAGIINEETRDKDISAEIIYLATVGYLKIAQINKKVLGIFDLKDYELTILKDISEIQKLPNNFDRELLYAIFGVDLSINNIVALSSLKNKFYISIPNIKELVAKSLLEKKYYTNLPKIIFSNKFFKTKVIFLLFWLGFFSFSFVGMVSGGNSIDSLKFFILIISVLIAGIVFLIFQRIMPAKSAKGVSTMEYLLGLKEYLQIAEKDRLNFHNAPDKKPEVFEKLLPYAMVFGVEKLWAKEFENIYVNPPSWYSGPVGGFSATSFTSQMVLFSSFTTTSLSSSPVASGSGGGGFSGGGGGGGGGGSW